MKKALTILFSLTLLGSGTSIADNFDYLDIAYSQQNTDWEDFTDSSSTTIKASVSLLTYTHVRARYHDGNVRFPTNARQETWTAYGIGAHYPVTPGLNLYIGADHNELELENRPTERGWYPHIGARYQANDQWQFALEVGESDVIFEDTTFFVETVYNILPALGLSATLRDYDDLDLTEYEVGVRWFFRQ